MDRFVWPWLLCLGGYMVPIRIQAQVLRRRRPAANASAAGVFAIVPDKPAESHHEAGARRKAGWRQADVKRAIEAAEQAGLQSYRIEIAPDGTISIIVGAPDETAGAPGLYDDLQQP